MILSAMQSDTTSTHAMKTHTIKRIAVFVLLTSLYPLFAADQSKKAADPFAGAFFPPELVLLAQDRIALSPEQLEAVRARVEKTQPRSDELRMKLERETAALLALTKQERVDETPLLAQLDKVLDVEREVKHLHVGAGVAIKNLLTPEQQAKLRELSFEIAKNHAAFTKLEEEAGNRISAKAERVKAGAQRWADSGRDPSAIAKAMEEKFKPLMEADKVFEAEAELDRALKLLGQDGKSTGSPTAPTEAVHQRVAAKVERVTQAVKQLAEGGNDPSAILKTMGEKVGPLLDTGKFIEAEAELDRVLKQLGQDAK
jgi:Spy/CpxP family protein refolding chaperone